MERIHSQESISTDDDQETNMEELEAIYSDEKPHFTLGI